jgi:hypothetical protein
MPAPIAGRISHTAEAIEDITAFGTIGKYDLYTQVGVGPTGTVTGSITGIIVKAKALVELDSAQVIRVNEAVGTVVGMAVAGFGQGLGSLIGSVVAGTTVADSNTVLLKAFQLGTVASGGLLTPAEPAAGAVISGTVTLLELGR